MTHSEVYWVAWNFLWNNLYLETGSSMFKSQWSLSFFFALGSLKIVKLLKIHSKPTVSFPCPVIPISSIMWTHNALIGLFNPIKPAGCFRNTSCFINIYVFMGVSVVRWDVLWFCLPPYFDVFIASLVPVHLVESKKYLIKGDTFQCSLVFKWCCMSLLFIS